MGEGFVFSIISPVQPSLGQPKVRDTRFVSRYNGSGIVTFCDGHSESIRAATQTDTLNTNNIIWEQLDPAVAGN